MKLTEIKAAYTKEDLHAEAGRDPWGRYCMRPLSFYLAWLCIRLGITANQVTWTGLGIGLVGCTFLAFGGWQFTLVGAGLMIIRSLTDRTDGCVAKATNTVSEHGRHTDISCDTIIEVLLPIAVGIGLYRQLDFLPIMYPLLGLIDSSTKFARYLSIMRDNIVSLEPKSGILRYLYRFGYFAVMFKEPTLLVCTLGNALYVFTAFYALLGIGRVTLLIKKEIK